MRNFIKPAAVRPNRGRGGAGPQEAGGIGKGDRGPVRGADAAGV